MPNNPKLVPTPEPEAEQDDLSLPPFLDRKGGAQQEEPASTTAEAQPDIVEEQLDEEEREFRALRRDLPGVKGASCRRHRRDLGRQDADQERVLPHASDVSTDRADRRS